MRKDLLALAQYFDDDRTWLMFMAMFAPIERVQSLIYEAEQKLSV